MHWVRWTSRPLAERPDSNFLPCHSLGVQASSATQDPASPRFDRQRGEGRPLAACIACRSDVHRQEQEHGTPPRFGPAACDAALVMSRRSSASGSSWEGHRRRLKVEEGYRQQRWRGIESSPPTWKIGHTFLHHCLLFFDRSPSRILSRGMTPSAELVNKWRHRIVSMMRPSSVLPPQPPTSSTPPPAACSAQKPLARESLPR